MLRRLVALTVIVSLLGLGTAAAWAESAGDLAASASTALDRHAQHEDVPNSPEAGHCDHGCHLSAHLTGLTSSLTIRFDATPASFATDLDLPLIASAQAPPRKPPRARV